MWYLIGKVFLKAARGSIGCGSERRSEHSLEFEVNRDKLEKARNLKALLKEEVNCKVFISILKQFLWLIC